VKIKIVLKFLGLVTASVALWMFIPLLWAYVYATGDVKLFFISASAGFAVAGLLYTLGRNASLKEIGSREAFAAVTFSWIAASAIGTFPYWFGGTLSFSDAFFEAMSGFSSTGGTMIVNLESCTQSLLLWRSLTQWLGGMGIILLALAIIPMGGSSLQLYRAEIPGPVQERLTPRIQQTALFLWGVYLTLTIAELLLLLLSGLSFFDALTHSFATISTGGFSTHSAGIGHFKSAQVEWVITLFMFLSGTNFTLYYLALSNKRVSAFLEDPEFRFYGSILFFGSLIIFAILMASGNRDSILDTFSHSLFQIVSVVTTTGFFYRGLHTMASGNTVHSFYSNVQRGVRHLDRRRHH
jgi:Trk-type K+ transport systems, membrane components